MGYDQFDFSPDCVFRHLSLKSQKGNRSLTWPLIPKISTLYFLQLSKLQKIKCLYFFGLQLKWLGYWVSAISWNFQWWLVWVSVMGKCIMQNWISIESAFRESLFHIKFRLITRPTVLAMSQQHKISHQPKSMIFFILRVLYRCKLQIFQEQKKLCRSSQ